MIFLFFLCSRSPRPLRPGRGRPATCQRWVGLGHHQAAFLSHVSPTIFCRLHITSAVVFVRLSVLCDYFVNLRFRLPGKICQMAPIRFFRKYIQSLEEIGCRKVHFQIHLFVQLSVSGKRAQGLLQTYRFCHMGSSSEHWKFTSSNLRK